MVTNDGEGLLYGDDAKFDAEPATEVYTVGNTHAGYFNAQDYGKNSTKRFCSGTIPLTICPDDDAIASGPSYILAQDNRTRENHNTVPLNAINLEARPCPRIPSAVHLDLVQLACGTIRANDTVELENDCNRVPGCLTSGDFLRVKTIFKDVKTNSIKLRGLRLRRCKYLSGQFKSKQ